MTTPRVTVPVEPTADMNIAGGIAICEARETALTAVDEADACFRAMLSAAPAPGGAVLDERGTYLRENLDVVLRAVEDMARIGIEVAKQGAGYQTEARDRARIDFVSEVCRRWAAIATREEAPAELLRDTQQLGGAAETEGYAIKAACIAWHKAKGSDPFDVLYNGAWCGSFPHQTGPERWTFTVPAMKEAIAAYLRAQPQAREDAQPVGRAVEMCGSAGKTSMGIFDAAVVPVGSPLYTRPAPDAPKPEPYPWRGQ